MIANWKNWTAGSTLPRPARLFDGDGMENNQLNVFWADTDTGEVRHIAMTKDGTAFLYSGDGSDVLRLTAFLKPPLLVTDPDGVPWRGP